MSTQQKVTYSRKICVETLLIGNKNVTLKLYVTKLWQIGIVDKTLASHSWGKGLNPAETRG